MFLSRVAPVLTLAGALTIAISKPSQAIPPITAPGVHLYTNSSKTVAGLFGSYVNVSLEPYSAQDDWRLTQSIAGTRVDPAINFTTSGWGARAPLHLTGGTDADWDNFSVQWDGYIEVTDAAARFAITSDDGSRMWIDVNRDNTFASGGDEFIDNGWGRPHAPETSPSTIPLAPGLYRIRIQYCEDFFGNTMVLSGVPRETVRFAYVIPSDRAPQSAGVNAIRLMATQVHAWYGEQMDRFGMGARSFHYETEPDGVTPKIHVVYVADTAESLRVDLWGRVGAASQAAGVPLWSVGEVWVLMPQTYLQMANNTIIGGTALGAGYGSGSAPGVAMLGSEKLSMTYPDGITDNRAFHGLVFPAVGPRALVQSVSFPGFEGSTVSSVVSSHVGALAHEMGHAFGAPHDGRNDDNFLGNVMGNGLRGIRGSLYPDSYPNEYAQLTYGFAAALSVNRFFEPVTLAPFSWASSARIHAESQNAELAAMALNDALIPGVAASVRLDAGAAAWPDRVGPPPTVLGAPEVTLLTSGTVTPFAGLLPIRFQATATSPIREAWLIRDGNLVEEMRLNSTAVDAIFRTTWYTSGGTSNYEVHVYDSQGNRASASASMTAASGHNHAPAPFIHVTPGDPHLNRPVTLSATQSSDPDHAASTLNVEWDIDGDGVYDTAPTTTKTLVRTFSTPGVRLIRARLTDPMGAQTVSAPVAIRVGTTPVDVETEVPDVALALSARPAPLRPGGRLVYRLPSAAAVSLEVFDVQGRVESRLLRGQMQAAGVHEVAWPATDASGQVWRPGVRFFRLSAGGREVVQRVVVVD